MTSPERLRHVDEVAGHLGFNFPGERLCTGFHVSSPRVEDAIIFAQVDRPEIHEAASGTSATLFGFSHQHRPDAAFLSLVRHREQTQVGAITPPLQINAAGQTVLIVRNEIFGN